MITPLDIGSSLTYMGAVRWKGEGGMKIFTHMNVDLDAVCSVWAARRFIQGANEAELKFVKSNWDGKEMEIEDLTLDVFAGGRGWKGYIDEERRVHSCFKYVVDHFAPREDREILEHLVAFVDMQDSRGEALRHLLPNLNREAMALISAISFKAFFYAVKTMCRGNDALTVNTMTDLLSGYLESRSRSLSDLEMNDFLQTVEFFGNGTIAVAINPPDGFSGASLFQRGVVVYVYSNGNDMGVRRRNSALVRMDHPRIRAVVEDVGEEIGKEPGKWFPHESGFLFSWGTGTSPASTPSKVDVRKLAHAVSEVLLSVPKEEWGIDNNSKMEEI